LPELQLLSQGRPDGDAACHCYGCSPLVAAESSWNGRIIVFNKLLEKQIEMIFCFQKSLIWFGLV
ncbi:hypothetical protein, partial [Paracidovorax citrulli]|uniref:hypothetical protein n=1 Tax=Paracidovorax citrulli TaxID=80869 RepID=UPI001B8A9294